MNFTKGLAGMFTFTIMLSTLTVLLPYLLSSLWGIMILIKERKNDASVSLKGAMAIGTVAFLFSLWAVSGLGLEIIGWGLLLLVIGIPFYLFMNRRGS